MNSPPCPLSVSQRGGANLNDFKYFYPDLNNMGKSKYLDLKVIKKYVRELRKNMTDSEKMLWKQLKNRQLSGYKFLRQHPIVYKADYKGLNYFIADFY